MTRATMLADWLTARLGLGAVGIGEMPPEQDAPAAAIVYAGEGPGAWGSPTERTERYDVWLLAPSAGGNAGEQAEGTSALERGLQLAVQGADRAANADWVHIEAERRDVERPAHVAAWRLTLHVDDGS